MLRYKLTILIIIYFQPVINANYWFEPLETNVGTYMVRSVFRDYKGYLWIGNQRSGLMKHNGYEVKRYTHIKNDTLSLSSNGVYNVYEDKNKNIWIATTNGLNKYIREKDIFIRYSLSDRPYSNFSRKIAESPSGDLWILTRNGLFKYNPNNNTFKGYYISEIQEENSFVCIDWDKDNNLWCATMNRNGFYKFNEKTGTFKHYAFVTNKHYPGVKSILIDSQNNFWYGQRGIGFAKFNPDTGSYNFFPINSNGTGTLGNFIFDIIEADSVNIMIGIDQGGINLYNRKTKKFTYITNDDPIDGNLSSNGIYCLHKDYEGIIWTGTSRGGVCYSNPKEKKFKKYNPAVLDKSIDIRTSHFPSYGFLSSFLEDSKGIIWIGTDGGGVNTFNRKTKKFYYLKNTNAQPFSENINVVRSTAEDLDNNIWITPWEGDIVKYNQKTKSYSIEKFQTPHLLALGSNTYWTMKIDSKDRFWVSYAYGRVGVFNKNKKKVREYFVGDSVNYMDTKVHEAKNGDFYIVSRAGVHYVDKELSSLKKIVHEKSIITFDFQDDGSLWFASDQGTIYHSSADGNIDYSHKLQLENDNPLIKAIAYTPDQLWISTNDGLILFNISKNEFIHFDVGDGLHGNQFFLQSVLKTKDGQLFFGGNKGFTTFFPSDIIPNKTIPPVYINKLIISKNQIGLRDNNNNQQVIRTEFLNEIKVKWKKNLSLEFQFVGISFTYPNKNEYSFKLHGFDKNWQNTKASSRKAVYTNLNPGEYTFQVKASNNDGVWNESGKSIKLIIQPPFWQKMWFISIVILFFCLIIYGIILLRVKKVKRSETILKRKVEERTIVISSQKEKLNQQYNLLEEKNKELDIKQKKLKTQNDELFMHRNNLQKLIDVKTADLLAAKQKAEESERLKSAFLANMSHEIRTPMNAIVGFSGLLNDPELSVEDRKNFVSVITSNSEALLHLVEDILDFSLIESNQMKIQVNDFYLNDLMNNIFKSFVLNKNSSNIDFRLQNSLETENIIIKSDEYRIRQIISNLISNAFKFTEEGYIEFGCRKRQNKIEFYVKDTGIGMTDLEKKYIFKQFVKLDTGSSNNKRGIGLGLSISKRLANMLNGNLTVISQKNIGSEFILSIG